MATRPSSRSYRATTRARAGTRRRWRVSTSRRGPPRPCTSRDWQLSGLDLSPDAARVAVVEGYSSDHGLLSGSVRIVDARVRRRDRPVAGPGDGRPRILGRRRFALVLAHRGHGQRLRPHLPRRAPRGAVARRSVHRRRHHHPVLRDHRRRGRRLDDTSGPRQGAGTGDVRSRAMVAGRAGRRSTATSSKVVSSPTFAPSAGWGRAASRSKEWCMTPLGSGRSFPDDRVRARWTDVELGVVLLGLRTERRAARVGRLRVSSTQPTRQHRPGPRVRAGGDRRRRRRRLPRHHGGRGPRDRRRIRGSEPPRHRRAVLWRVHGRVGGGADRSVLVRPSRCRSSRITSRST